ncbi:DUF998 domain-containing protein [Micromonospora sp. NPDC005163]
MTRTAATTLTGSRPPRRSGRLALAAGAACWLLTLGYLAAQPLVAASWDPPYSFTANTISDLGNTLCGQFERPDGTASYVCSPRHAWMNTAFVLVGLLTTAGAILTRSQWPRRRLATIGVALVAAAGVGGVLVGFAPADVNLAVHTSGALLQVPGAAGMLLLGLATVKWRGWVPVFGLMCGTVATAACVLFLAGTYLGLGTGGMERLAFDTLTVWTGVLGGVFLRDAVNRQSGRP